MDDAWRASSHRRTARAIVCLVSVLIFVGLVVFGVLQVLAIGRDDGEFGRLDALISRAEAEISSREQDLEDSRRDQRDAEDAVLQEVGASSPNQELLSILERRAEEAASRAEADEAELNGALGALATTEEQKSAYLVTYTKPLVRWTTYAVVVAAFAALGGATGLFVYAERRRAFENQVIIDGAATASDMKLSTRWEANEKRLQHYHKLVQNYSTSTRQVTLATILGEFIFLVLIGSGFLLISDTSTAIAAAIVTAVFAGVTGYVANVVLRNADTSSREVREFFLHPIAVERHLAAERIISHMDPPDQGAARLILVGSLAHQPEGAGASRDEWGRDESGQPAMQGGQ